ncbi:MAG: hypothetical protein J6V70_08360, partial [Kiritimatiellae bacterium]|nr:hypothetical protein [Kiritimatiellia bacterium]
AVNPLIHASAVLGWCFVDWNLGLNKQSSAQGIYLYCMKAAMDLAQILGMDTAALQADYDAKRAAAEALWDEESGFYISGEGRQISWASQVWMTLGGAKHRWRLTRHR